MLKNGNQGDGGGRPPIIFDEQQVKLVEQLSAVLTKGQLSDYFNVSENTFRQIEGRQPEVSEAYQKGRAKAIAGVGANLINQARRGNITAAIFYLKTQAGWRENDLDVRGEPPKIYIVKPDQLPTE